MLTEDDLRNMFADDDTPQPLSPATVRRRARALRRRRQAGLLAAAAIAIPALVLGAQALPLSHNTSVTPTSGGNSPALGLPDGSVALRAPHMFAWTTADGVCYGEGPLTSQFRSCVTAADKNHAQGWTLSAGVGGAIVHEPVTRAEFVIDGATTVPAQVVGFAHHPQWRILTANLNVPDSDASNIEVLGWDATGNRVLVLGDCQASCAPGAVAPSTTPITTTTSTGSRPPAEIATAATSAGTNVPLDAADDMRATGRRPA